MINTFEILNRFLTIGAPSRSIAITIAFLGLAIFSSAQTWHKEAHAHNDYLHPHPLKDALANGFTSVEADVHLKEGELYVAHDQILTSSHTLQALYFEPLDSLLKINQTIFRSQNGGVGVFFLMIDVKSDSENTWKAIRELLSRYPNLQCGRNHCPVRIFISGNRPMNAWKERDPRLCLDGRPAELKSGFSSHDMPLVSDNYASWSSWKGTSLPTPDDLKRIKDLAARVHGEGKRLRLWAIPDNEMAWGALLDAGVDIINTDQLAALNKFLISRGR